MVTQHDPKSLLGLPAEIYTGKVRNNGRLPIALTGIELAATCKAVHNIMNENLLFYKVNTFFLGTSWYMKAYIRTIGLQKAAAIQSVEYLLYSLDLGGCTGWKELTKCTGLKHLVLKAADLSNNIFIDSGFQSFFLLCESEILRKDYERLISLRGLQTFEIHFSPEPASPFFSQWCKRDFERHRDRGESWLFACTHNNTIMPEQFAPGLAKFSLRIDHVAPLIPGFCPSLTRHQGALLQELSAFDITITCRTIHNLVEGDKIFYAVNEFEFCNTQALLNYLVALPSNRRNAIRSIKVKYDYHGMPTAAFIMLAVCYGLKHLLSISQAPGYPQLVALKGLKSVKLTRLSLRRLFLPLSNNLSGMSLNSLPKSDRVSR
ncbi:hypothetical protein N431DRAFT_501404 [Stipitochalara longipes BDJ]|nr:hypothetical protein N431DRAFT_501404 [Stipitochalara longipes BDJ]